MSATRTALGEECHRTCYATISGKLDGGTCWPPKRIAAWAESHVTLIPSNNLFGAGCRTSTGRDYIRGSRDCRTYCEPACVVASM